ncbi:PREDICTED: CMP-N-acetylneuraminate-beta-galactosamide-alpha-2,3-sialyltransferase 4 isoform X12 [Corvus brachyrhynchos]|uniref:CMP-N-acetylneuraminate-beta-galactosamide- alpha-2,3-sialyltransferase 4 isoform X12 n=1 Tax=Corvus brachyrhynchos TaxID=85066 RepID=UPI0008167149|nr:PREDICTED: CMP-N-acetylneuraminate-beta-galactosamide-alpha-2,3-sialyltransferase 4 isoform X12 [Corvus brachyrhynchos]
MFSLEEDELTWILFPSQLGFCSLPPREVILTEGGWRWRWSTEGRTDGLLPHCRGREDGPVDPAELLPAPPGPRGRAVTSDESSGPRLIPFLLLKMLNKSRGKILGVLALFLVMVWYSIYREDRYTQLFYFPVQENNKTTCPLGEVEKKAAQLIGNYTRDHPLFLQLKDYFWVKTPSLYELPYGTKGSEDVLLRLLSITHYSLPESIRSLKCRRCAVVGNGHRLRNSSMGDTINTYDVVIRTWAPRPPCASSTRSRPTLTPGPITTPTRCWCSWPSSPWTSSGWRPSSMTRRGFGKGFGNSPR